MRFILSIVLTILAFDVFSNDIIYVSGEQESLVIRNIKSNATYVLGEGFSGNVQVLNSGSDNTQINIKSENYVFPSKIVSLVINGSQNIAFEHVIFDYNFNDDDKIYYRPFRVMSSVGVSISDSVFDGDLARNVSDVDDGYGYAVGLSVRGSSDITITDTSFFDFHVGAVFSSTNNIVFHRNRLERIRMDGLTFAQVSDVEITENIIKNFNRSIESSDHADMIQFWTQRTTEPSKNILIAKNILDSSEGWYTHSIFMRNELVDTGRADYEMFYRNINIIDNVVINAHIHGIYVGATDGLNISNNTVVRNPASQGVRDNLNLWTPRISVYPESLNVEIERNMVSSINGFDGQLTWTLLDNLIVSDGLRGLDNYSEFFSGDFSSQGLRVFEDFYYKPDSYPVLNDIGSSLLISD
ncbi:putative RTX toxin [Nitrincola lacisaponensis]|uniref:Putative RTX toxin n=1 Tax=Nitrincola lacisaponensis TaxID=267850 RepID=A0A063Y0L6_9GAMM|nr:right-handed parallel beta-helix repeat-containing protein [Nitrincola lacisaponensis]KDE39244.1 putative RTX toxin [Nitrincola lacisaponensis]